MSYILFGTEEYTLQKEYEKIIEENNISPLEINKYTGEEIEIQNILEDIHIIPMFGTKKLIVIDPATFLTGSSKKTITETEIDNLERFLKSKNKENILVLIVHHEKLDERKKIVKLLKKYSTIKECKTKNNEAIVKSFFKGYKIEDSTIAFFISRVGDNLLQLKEEADKLKLYRLTEKEITKEDIQSCTIQSVDLNIFTLIENIITKRKKEAIETYKEMLKGSEEPLAIIIMLANQIRIMYQSKELFKKGYSEKATADTLNIHPFRVKKALEKASMYHSDTLLSYLKTLIKLDIDIKSGKINKDLALELFILQI